MNVNVSVNGETYMNCTIIGDYISWKANNTPVNFFSHLGLYESLVSTLLDEALNKRMGQLRIRGSPELNGTKITCIAAQIGTEFSNSKSDTVMILVQGTRVTTSYYYTNLKYMRGRHQRHRPFIEWEFGHRGRSP